SHFECHDSRQAFLFLVEQLRGGHHPFRALSERCSTMPFEGGRRFGKFLFDFRRFERAEFLERLAGGGIDRCDRHGNNLVNAARKSISGAARRLMPQAVETAWRYM